MLSSAASAACTSLYHSALPIPSLLLAGGVSAALLAISCRCGLSAAPCLSFYPLPLLLQAGGLRKQGRACLSSSNFPILRTYYLSAWRRQDGLRLGLATCSMRAGGATLLCGSLPSIRLGLCTVVPPASLAYARTAVLLALLWRFAALLVAGFAAAANTATNEISTCACSSRLDAPRLSATARVGSSARGRGGRSV